MSLRQRHLQAARLLATAAVIVGLAPAAQAFDSPDALIAAAKSSLVAARDPTKSELQLTLADFAPMTEWPGPKTSAKAPQNKKIIAISCATVAPFCANVAKGAVEAAQALVCKPVTLMARARCRASSRPLRPPSTKSPMPLW